MEAPRYAEELFLRADAMFGQGNLHEAKQLLEEIIEVEPRYGRAYNHLGWLYTNEFQDPEQGEELYKLALKFSPGYPATYANFIYLLVGQGRLEEAEQVLELAKQIPGFDDVKQAFFKGLILEAGGWYKLAVKQYKLAAKRSLDNGFIAVAKESEERARKKAGVVILFGIRL